MQTNLGKQKHRFISHTSKGEFSANFLKCHNQFQVQKYGDICTNINKIISIIYRKLRPV